jgi:hypothetical protein
VLIFEVRSDGKSHHPPAPIWLPPLAGNYQADSATPARGDLLASGNPQLPEKITRFSSKQVQIALNPNPKHHEIKKESNPIQLRNRRI